MNGKQLATDMLVAAARRFVERCERGEVRSVRTYAEMRDALAFYDVAEDLPTVHANDFPITPAHPSSPTSGGAERGPLSSDVDERRPRQVPPGRALARMLTDEDVREIERQLGLPQRTSADVSWAPDLVAIRGARFEGFPPGPYRLDVYLDRRSSELVVRFLLDEPGFSDSARPPLPPVRAKSEKRRRHTRRK